MWINNLSYILHIILMEMFGNEQKGTNFIFDLYGNVVNMRDIVLEIAEKYVAVYV